MNKLLMEENDRLQKQVSQLVYENGYYRQQTQSVRVDLSRVLPLTSSSSSSHCKPTPRPLPPATLQAGLTTTDTSCESVVTSGHQNVAAAQPQAAQPRDASPAGYAILSWPQGWPARAPFAFATLSPT